MRTRKYRCGRWRMILLIALWALGPCLHSSRGADRRINLGQQTNFKIIPEFYEPLPGEEGAANRVKTLIQGDSARLSQDETALVQGMWLGSFNRDGTTNLFATAPECLVDIKNQTARSPGPLAIETGNGQLAIRGQGFFCKLTNVVLVISNAIETSIQRDVMRASKKSGSQLVSDLVLVETAETNQVAVTNLPLRIFADRFVFDQASNTVVYAGNVRAVDPAFVLTSQRLIITLSTNGRVEQIEALDQVTMRTEDESRQAFGDRALYVMSEGRERVLISGQPARWTDGPRSGRGPRFDYEPGSQRLLCAEPSVVRLPKSDLLQPQFDLSGSTTNGEPAATNEFVEVTAGYLETMPVVIASNRTSRTLLASNNVVISSPSDQGRASGHYATYSEITGVFALHGNATWSGEDERLVRGDSFHFNQTNRSFRVQGNSYLKLPLASFGTNSTVARMFQNRGTNAAAGGEYLEIRSDRIHYLTNRLDFEDQVRLFLRRGEELLGRMQCHVLTLSLTNQEVRQIVAEHDVLMEQLPVLAGASNLVEKSLASEWFTVFMNTNGLIKEMIAQTNVLIRQIEYDPTKTAPIKTDLSSEIVTAYFAATTNSIERIVADGNVVIDQAAGKATCNQAIYTQASNNLLLNGDVKLETPRGLLNAPAAILRHFNLWPGGVNRLQVPLRQPGPNNGSNTNQPPAAPSRSAAALPRP